MTVFNADTTPLEFPCQVGIKAMGSAQANMVERVEEIAALHARIVQTKSTSSRNGQYISVTVTVEAHSREQLETLYGALNHDEAVLFTL